jgi:ATP/maltotriose-dependent transcriptional regulator MalT
MPANDSNILKLLGNKVNARIITFLSRHPMSPRDLSKYLGKNEADISRRLRLMERKGLVESKWGTRLGKNVKLYYLLPSSVVINFQQDGLELELKEREKPRHVQLIDSKESDSPQEQELLIGRNTELKLLSNEQFRFFCIVGVAGMGKSSLAHRFLQITKANDNAFWHTFKEIDTLTYLIGKITAFLSKRGIHDISRYVNVIDAANNEYESETLEIITDALNKVKCTMIFDDFHKMRDEKISIFLRHLQQHSKNKILVLTRSKPPFYLDDVHSKELVLQGMPLEDARAMISQLGFNTDENTVVNLWRRFSGHPMTLKIFSLFAKAKHVSFNNNESVPSIDSINDYFQKEILEILSSDEQNILLNLSVFRTPVKSKAFKGISINQRNLVFLLHSLEKKMIISRTASDKFLVHDMLRDILYPMITYPEDAHSTAALYYLSEGTAENVIESLYHFTKCHDTESIIRILRDEVIEEKYRMIEDGYAAPLIEILSQINLQNITRDQLGYFYNIKGKALSMLQRWEEAKENLEKTMKSSEDSSDKRLLGYSLRNYGESLYLHGDLTGAEKRLRNAAKIFSRYDGAQKALRSTYVMLARLYFATGRPEQSKTYSDLATSISLI